jgi:hypothetical protein
MLSLHLLAAALCYLGVEQRNQLLARGRRLDGIPNHDLLRGDRLIIEALVGIVIRF